MKLNEILKLIDINSVEYDKAIFGINSLVMAGESDISFFSDHNDKYKKELSETKALAVLINKKHIDLLPKHIIPIIDDNPYLKMAELSKIFSYKIDNSENRIYSKGQNCSIHPSVNIGKNVTIKDNVTIMSGSYIGDWTIIDSNTIVHPNVTIYHHSQIGKNCIIHSGTVIGSEGFGYTKNLDNKYIKIYQNGNVDIHNNVEIGSNSSIDRATFNSTIIESNVKIDNLVHIAHNCKIGESTMIMAQVGMAGSVTIGKNVIIGGSAAISGFITIEDNVMITGNSTVMKNLEKNKIYTGYPVEEHKNWLKNQSKLRRIVKKYAIK